MGAGLKRKLLISPGGAPTLYSQRVQCSHPGMACSGGGAHLEKWGAAAGYPAAPSRVLCPPPCRWSCAADISGAFPTLCKPTAKLRRAISDAPAAAAAARSEMAGGEEGLPPAPGATEEADDQSQLLHHYWSDPLPILGAAASAQFSASAETSAAAAAAAAACSSHQATAATCMQDSPASSSGGGGGVGGSSGACSMDAGCRGDLSPAPGFSPLREYKAPSCSAVLPPRMRSTIRTPLAIARTPCLAAPQGVRCTR